MTRFQTLKSTSTPFPSRAAGRLFLLSPSPVSASSASAGLRAKLWPAAEAGAPFWEGRFFIPAFQSWPAPDPWRRQPPPLAAPAPASSEASLPDQFTARPFPGAFASISCSRERRPDL
ncbi:hypothetical protein MTO96_011637 [Rhipicephalus appendiculatus]